MSEKKFIVYYSEKHHKYFLSYFSWFDINDETLKPILYSNSLDLIKKVKYELNEQLRK